MRCHPSTRIENCPARYGLLCGPRKFVYLACLHDRFGIRTHLRVSEAALLPTSFLSSRFVSLTCCLASDAEIVDSFSDFVKTGSAYSLTRNGFVVDDYTSFPRGDLSFFSRLSFLGHGEL